MAVNTNFLVTKARTPGLDTGSYYIIQPNVFPAAGIANGDNVQLVEIPYATRMEDCFLQTSGTLGAATTVQLQLNRSGARSNITAAVAAGAAGFARMNIAPFTLLPGDLIEVLIGGAAVTVAATVTIDLELQRL